MTLDKTRIQQDLDKILRKRKLFLILSIVCFAIGGIGMVAFDILYYLDIEGPNAMKFMYGSYLSGVIAIVGAVLIIVRARFYGYQARALKAILNDEVKVVAADESRIVLAPKDAEVKQEPIDVKPIEKDPKHQLIDEYKNLLEQGLITQEDFDKRKSEILGN